MSLVQQAKEGKLPLCQNIDTETLQWIKNNEPQELIKVDFISLASLVNNVGIENLSRFTPSTFWFTSSKKANSLHGIRHLMRVTAYTWLLARNMNQTRKNSLFIAASLHDIRRLNDKADKGHANRAAKWYEENKDKVLSVFGIDDADNGIIVRLIKTHEQDYDNLKSSKFYREYGKLVDILKTSDALDRYIQPKRRWWLKDKYLNLKPGLELKAFAFDLIIKSEERFLSGVDSKEAVLSSLRELQACMVKLLTKKQC